MSKPSTNPAPFFTTQLSELQKLGTRHLQAIRQGTFRYRQTCGCSVHCGDDVLSESERAFNRDLIYLRKRVNKALEGREDTSTPKQTHKREKKWGPKKNESRHSYEGRA